MNEIGFYVAAAVALASTIMVVANTNPVHALLSLVLSLLSVAVVFFTIGAPFAGAFEVIVYAGAIMMLNLGTRTQAQERTWLRSAGWIAPVVLAAVLLVQLVVALAPHGSSTPMATQVVDAKAVGIALFGPYLLAVELASTLLLAGLVAAYHLGRTEER